MNTANKILNALRANNSDTKMYLVGGAVRDEILGIKSKDTDYIVVGQTLDSIKKSIGHLGKVDCVGVSFGILKLNTHDGEEIDISVPRTEVCVGDTHRDFIVNLHGISLMDDLMRRDFTMNAIAKDVETNEYIDPYNGIMDIHNKIIRCVGNPDERFTEDALRLLRAIQFAVRLNFIIELKTYESMIRNCKRLDNVFCERILIEIQKSIDKRSVTSNDILLYYLGETGFGVRLFGDDFSPVSYNGKEMIPNIIALFLNGGNYHRMTPSLEYIRSIELARNIKKFVNTKTYPWSYMNGRNHFKVVSEFYKNASKNDTSYKHELDLIAKIERCPIELKELDITGNHLIALGFKGKQIGNAVKMILKEIFDGNISNTYTDILKFLALEKETILNAN